MRAGAQIRETQSEAGTGSPVGHIRGTQVLPAGWEASFPYRDASRDPLPRRGASPQGSRIGYRKSPSLVLGKVQRGRYTPKLARDGCHSF